LHRGCALRWAISVLFYRTRHNQPRFAQLIWRRGGAPGTFPQVILTRHPDLPRSRRAMPSQTKAPRPRYRRWRESAPTPIQLSRARSGVWKAPAHAHSHKRKRQDPAIGMSASPIYRRISARLVDENYFEVQDEFEKHLVQIDAEI